MGKFGAMKRAKDWVGCHVITLREMKNGYVVIPKGTRCRVTYAHSGLNLTSDPCSHCGLAARIGKVPYTDVRPVGDDR